MTIDSTLTCRIEQRRQSVRRQTDGLDYVEVELFDRHGRPLLHPRLLIRFLGKAPEETIKPNNVRIEGGRRILGSDLRIISTEVQKQDDPELDDTLIVTIDKSGDFSTYTLKLVAVDQYGPYQPFPGLDQRYYQVPFSFKAECPSDLDCKTQPVCPPEKRDEPETDYLAKDYASFRQLILDRLALIMPEWQERHVPDIGITLVEILAYTGDYLSYHQDAVATEAYLDTTRQRISVRRHVRLVDYPMHEGCNARSWVCVETGADLPTLDPKEIFFVTGYNAALAVAGSAVSQDVINRIPRSQYEVFEPMTAAPIQLYKAHSKIRFYTWGDHECCLSEGATTATLIDEGLIPPQETAGDAASPAVPAPEHCRKLNLQAGDILIFEEVIGPKTGDPHDADPKRRHAVRLTKITPSEDKLFDPPILIVEIEWAAEDALPFPLCISAIGPAPECKLICDISIARGNVILVDHGETIHEELGCVPTKLAEIHCEGPDQPSETSIVPGRFYPHLNKGPLTFRQPLPQKPGSIDPASQLLTQDPRQAIPQIWLTSIPPAPNCPESAPSPCQIPPLFTFADLDNPMALARKLKAPSDPTTQFLVALLSLATKHLLSDWENTGSLPDALRGTLLNDLKVLLKTWLPKGDLLESGPDDAHFVAEIDNNGRAHLRFGDGELGTMPAAGTEFCGTYRVGNGLAGNVGAEAISHIVFRGSTLSGGITRVRNPMAAKGGVDPEPLAEIKLFAPYAFRDLLQRAITADDYARLAERNSKVQRAKATLQWTGTWYEAQVAIDPLGTETPDQALLAEINGYLYVYRRLGHDLVVTRADYVALDIVLSICVKPHYLRGHVEAALLDVFGNRALPDGRLGFFHPDALTFGEGIDLSKLVAAAQAVEGVESVTVTRLQRKFEAPNHEIENGILPLSPAEIAQLDNDPSFPEHGTLSLEMRGGR